MEKNLSLYTLQATTTKLESDVYSLKNKLSSELTGARFLWTTGQLLNDGYIPWDLQIVNIAPSVIQWKKNSTAINIRIPGLYKLTVAIFSLEAIVLQIYLNNEPICSYQPTIGQPNSQLEGLYAPLKRLKHSIGEVTSWHLEEYISLPPDATVSIRYHANTPAQGFLAIQKI